MEVFRRLNLTSLIAIAFICSLATNAVAGILTRDEPLYLSGDAAIFFNDYIIPMANAKEQTRGDYKILYGYETNESIKISLKNKSLDHGQYLKNSTSKAIPELTKKELVSRYCLDMTGKALLPDNPYYSFIHAKNSKKELILTYYDMSGQSMLFSIGVNPKSCEK